MGKVQTVCIRCVPTLHRMHVESRVFYPTKSQRSCHVKHSTCNQNVAIHSMFNIQEFQVSFSPLYCTSSRCILHGKSGYSVHSVCSYIAQNVLCITSVLSNDIAAILPCKARYVQPKFSHTLHFQYTRVSSCFFTIILYCKQVFLHGKSAYSVYTVCSYIAKNVLCIASVLSNEIAAILQCTALYVQSKCSHTHHV